MVVQHNLTAMNANRYLGINNSKLSKSLEKLSSGYKINRAGDDAAGLAVSEKMRSQIAGMTQGVKNAQAGISMVQTYEGALTETDSILQRMKVLADQMANGSYDNEVDRSAAQLEFSQLNDELNQIADTDYNGVIVLNGGRMADGTVIDNANKLSTLPDVGETGASSANSMFQYSGGGNSPIKATYATNEPADGDNPVLVTFKGVTLALTTGANATGLGTDGNTAAPTTAGVTHIKTGTAIQSDGKGGFKAGTLVETKNIAVEDFAGDINGVAVMGKFELDGATYYTDKDSTAAATKIYDSNGVEVTLAALGASHANALGGAANGVAVAAPTAAAGYIQTVTTYTLADYAGDPQGDVVVSESNTYDNARRNLTYADSITLQVGARSKDAVNFTFKYQSDGIGDLTADLDCSARGLGTDQLNINTQEDANYAIDQIDNAINKVSMVRATFGAVQNRLEHKIDNLNVSVENLTDAESKIRDTNMAEEMMNFTKNNILAQASQSMLAQANQLPQSVLSLLQ